METALDSSVLSALDSGSFLEEKWRDSFDLAFREHLNRWSGRGAPVLLAETDAVQFLAAFWAALASERAVILANPAWRHSEWIQLQAVLGEPLEPLGAVPEPFHPKGTATPEPGEILIPTGGTAGGLKLARHHWGSLSAAARGLISFLGGAPLHSCCVLPLWHVSGLMQSVRALVSGGVLVLPGDWRSWRKAGFPDLPFRPDTYLSLVPTQLQALLKEAPDPVKTLRRFQGIFLGGASWEDAEARQFCRENRIPILSCYGMTETAAMATLQPSEDFFEGWDTVGRALPHVEIDLEAGTGAGSGRIRLRSQALFQGYWGEPKVETGSWFKTEDLGEWEAGRLRILGRADRQLITGGENVDPGEVETALRSHPRVTDALVFGREDPQWGQVLVTLVAVEGAATRMEESLKQFLSERLAGYKIPRHWYVGSAIPRTDSGKPKWDEVRQRMETGGRLDL